MLKIFIKRYIFIIFLLFLSGCSQIYEKKYKEIPKLNCLKIEGIYSNEFIKLLSKEINISSSCKNTLFITSNTQSCQLSVSDSDSYVRISLFINKDEYLRIQKNSKSEIREEILQELARKLLKNL